MTDLPPMLGLHHVKLPVSDLDRSLSFYERAFGARRIAEADHRRLSDNSLYAYILEVPGLGCWLELRLHPTRARAHAGFDTMTLSVNDCNSLVAWSEYLDAVGVRHSPVITAIRAWLLVVEDPDGNRLRLYSLETHGPEVPAEENHPWIADTDPA